MLFMVTSDGTRVLKMIDFGGTELKENHSKNPTNSAEEIKCMHQKVEFGTGPYLAPEQLQTFVLVFCKHFFLKSFTTYEFEKLTEIVIYLSM